MRAVNVFTYALSFFSIVFSPLAEARGILSRLTVDDKTYQVPIAGRPGPVIPHSPIRQISDASLPVKANVAIAEPAPFVVPANPGSTIGVLWQVIDHNRWLAHNTGIEVYLASCGSVSCDKFDASQAQWFKINQVGERGSEPVQQDKFDAKVHWFNLPSNLAHGGHILRHEIIALHSADDSRGAEFYSACIQINVSGDQTGAPSHNELGRFSGAYSDNEPGTLVNAFDGAPYDFGTPITELASGPSNDDPDPPSSSSVPSLKTLTPVRPSPTVISPESNLWGGNSKPKKVVYDDADFSYFPSIPALKTPQGSKPRYVSRVMARLIVDQSSLRNYPPGDP